MPSPPERWLRGPVPGFPPVLQPVAHSLLQARDEVEAASVLSTAELWVCPGGAAPAGFHLRHIAGSLDRLLTYARGAPLDDAQHAALARESEPGDPPGGAAELIELARRAIDQALEQVRRTPEATLHQERRVGRAGLPSTVLGLLFHSAEHTLRHAGQLVTTTRVVRGLGLAEESRRRGDGAA